MKTTTILILAAAGVGAFLLLQPKTKGLDLTALGGLASKIGAPISSGLGSALKPLSSVHLPF